MTPQQLQERILEYAAGICRLVDQLPKTRLEQHIANQIRQNMWTFSTLPAT